MKLNGNQLETWIKNNKISDLKLVLVYGPDAGGVDVNASRVAKEFDLTGNSSITKFDFKDVKDDISTLVNELSSIPLFGDAKVIILENCPQSLPKAMVEFLSDAKFLNDAKFSAKLILKSHELRPTSNLRKLAENSKGALSIACYKDDIRQVEMFVRAFLQGRGARFEAQAVSVLAQILPPNKLLLTSELEKLIIYKHGELITLKDVEDVISDSQEVALDDLCVSVALGQKLQTNKLIERAMNTDTSFMLILRVLQRYFNRVLEVLAYMEAGLKVDVAVGKLAPPVFFKQKDNLIRVCKVETKQKVLKLISDLVKLEFDCKRLPLDQYMLIANYLNARVM